MKLTRRRFLPAFAWMLMEGRGAAAADSVESDAWSGPPTRILFDGGVPRISIDGRRYDPFWLALNIDSIHGDWTYFDHSLERMLAYSVPIVEVNLGHVYSTEILDERAAHTAAGPKYLIVRINFVEGLPAYGHRSAYDGAPLSLRDLRDERADDARAKARSDEWLNYYLVSLEKIVRRLDSLLPGRIIGIRAEAIGENFRRPVFRMSDHSEAPVDIAGINGARQDVFFDDYSEDQLARFCGERRKSREKESCDSPGPRMRNEGAYGQNLMAAIGGEDRSAAAAFNRSISQRRVDIIEAMNRRVKRVTGGHALTLSFYGYINGLGWALPASGHTGLRRLEASPYTDAIAAPYAYGESRRLPAPLTAQGVNDSASLHGKLYVHEDDTLTALCAKDAECLIGPSTKGKVSPSLYAFYKDQPARTVEETTSFLRRNLVSAAIHGNGLYLIDLMKGMAFFDPRHPEETARLWASLEETRAIARGVTFSGERSFAPEIVIFTDDASVDFTPILGPPGADNYARSQLVYQGAITQLQRCGAPFRQYLLSDILDSTLALEKVKLVIFHNAYSVTAEIRSAIRDRLEGQGRSLLYIYAAGLLDEAGAPDLTAMSDFVGMQIRRGEGDLPRPVSNLVRFEKASSTFGLPDNKTWDPWFFVDDPDATPLGSYRGTEFVSFARRARDADTAYYSALPGLPSRLIRALARRAGAHLFSDHEDDIVEAGGNTLFLMPAIGGDRRIVLPFDAKEVASFPADLIKGIDGRIVDLAGLEASKAYVLQWG